MNATHENLVYKEHHLNSLRSICEYSVTVQRPPQRLCWSCSSFVTSSHFQLLLHLTHPLRIGDCAGGHRLENRGKNRDVMVVPRTFILHTIFPEKLRQIRLKYRGGGSCSPILQPYLPKSVLRVKPSHWLPFHVSSSATKLPSIRRMEKTRRYQNKQRARNHWERRSMKGSMNR